MQENQIRVLHIVAGMMRAGLETMLMNYYRRIDRTRIQFDFLEHTLEETAYDDEIRQLGGRVFKLPRANPLSPGYYAAEKNFYRSHHREYTIVHSHLNCLSGLVLSFAKSAEIPVRIAHSHNTDEERNLRYPVKMYYRSRIPKVATDLMSCGLDAGKWLFGARPFSVLNNPVDTGDFAFNAENRKVARALLQIEDEALAIGHIGRFFEQKNHDYLIEIFAEISKRRPDARLLLAGDGPLRDRIENKVKAMGLEQSVSFLGVSDRIPELLSAMDVFLLPSLFEGFPVTIVEAQASGLPCFISDTITKECALSPDVHMISLSKSPAEWAEMILSEKPAAAREAGRAAVINAGFDIEQNAKWLEDYYLGKDALARKLQGESRLT